MDLLNENQYEKPKQTKSKTIIITLLILSIFAVIVILVAMVYLDSHKVVKDTLYINNVQQEIASELIVSDNQGVQYISLKDLANLLGYEYYSSEYNNYGTDTAKCYIKNKKLISGFELGSKLIYKYEEETNLDYQYYTLNYDIITYNNKLYIALADLNKAINAQCTINENKEMKINTMEYLATVYGEQLKEKGYTVVTDQNNQKTLAYGWIIVKKNDMYSVLNTEFQEIIGLKYSSIYFDEYNLNYIVSNTSGLYGIISTEGVIEHSLKYDGLEILNYENMLYKVKNNQKYGIMKENGTMLTGIVYDEIGYPADQANKILYTLIIPEVDGKSGPTIVVKQNKFYGLVTLQKGETFLPCDHVEKLYSVSELGETYYRIEAEFQIEYSSRWEKQTLDLLDYLRLRGTEVVELN